MGTDFYIPSSVSKPARYLGIERNSVFKDPKTVKVRFALCYPDIYEVGMSYYGYFLLYELANTLEEVWCERCFAPWVDMEAYLRESQIPLFTLESKTPLSRMDVVGFSLTYELNMTNVLNMMELGCIKLKAEDRTSDPIVIGGGPSMMNPTPYEAFFDLIVVGEAESVLIELLKRFMEMKGLERSKIIKALSGIEGVYSPFFRKEKVKRLFVKDLNVSFHAKSPPVPTVGSIHDRLNIEISRGCGNGCRFCLAGYAYRPYRERSFAIIKEAIDTAIKTTGYEEVSLLSLSSGDHSQLFEIIRYISENYPGVSVSLPSLKIGTLKEKEISLIANIARTGFTFALESSSERIRRMLNKNIDLEAFHRQIPLLRRYGWKYVKVYLMIGFPWEREEDINELLSFLNPLFKERMEVHLSLSPFVPKPHTPFQYLGMENEESLKEKVNLIKAILKGKKAKLKYRDIRQSFAEAIISRGDRKLSDLFLYLKNQNTRFEAWREFFNFQKYVEWFSLAGLEMKEYLVEKNPQEPLPWDFIDSGVQKDFLIKEYIRSESSITTVSCYSGCAGCGLCDKNGLESIHKDSHIEEVMPTPNRNRLGKKIVLRFGKLGRAKYMGHLDTMKSLIRAMRSSGLLFITRGKYHPMPKISISQAVPVGLESTCEYLTAEVLDFDSDSKSLLKLINRSLPKGIKVFEIIKGSEKEEARASILVVGGLGSDEKNLEFLRERNGRRFYIFRGNNIREILKDAKFTRVIKIKEGKVDALRANY